MCRRRLPVMRSLMTLLVGTATSAAVGQAASAAPPGTITRLPGACCMMRQLDGSAICSSEHHVFLADGDFRRWSAMPSSARRMHWGALGGDRRRVFISTTGSTAGAEPNTIEAVDRNGRTAVVRTEMWPDQRAVFASKDVGVIYKLYDSANLMLTTDGGAAWTVAPVPFPEKHDAPRAESAPATENTAQSAAPGYGPIPPAGRWQGQGETAECVLALHWVSPSRLLVGGSRRSVGLFEIQRGALRPVWITALPEFARQFALDGDYAWVGDYGNHVGVGEREGAILHRLRLSDGRIDATVKTTLPLAGMAVCHQALLTWDHGTLVLVSFLTPCPPAPGTQPPVAPTRSRSENVQPGARKKGEAAYEPDSLAIWTRDAKGTYVRRAKICTRYLDMAAGRLGGNISGILPLEAPCCLLISGQGAGFQLDLDKPGLSPVALQVTPPPPAPVGSQEELEQLFALYLSLLSQVPPSVREEIGKEYMRQFDPIWGGRRGTVSGPSAANGTADGERLPLRECNLRAIRRLREYLESKKPRVLDLNMANDNDLPHIENLATLEYLCLGGSPVTDAGLAHLQDATQLKELDLGATLVTGTGLVHLQKLAALRRLVLTCPKITDAGMAGLDGLPQLEALVLTRIDMRDGVELISDAGLVHISKMTQLRELDLCGARITDASLETLKRLTRLQRLNLGGTDVTAEGLTNLQRALPNCQFVERTYW